MNDLLSIYDVLLPPLYLIIAIAYGYIVTKRNINKNPEYEYFLKGLVVRIFGAIALGLVYFFYYGAGDTLNYHQTASAYSNLTKLDDFLEGLFGSGLNYYFNFNADTGFPIYRQHDQHAFFVVRLLIPIEILGCKSYFSTAILVATLTYGGLWKLYQTFLKEFPLLRRQLAIACLFVPSCVFWGSGLMKDSFTLSAVGWFTYGFYSFFISKKRTVKYILILVAASLVILAIKPYIFFALIPGSILWMSNNIIKQINHKFVRLLFAPFLFTIGIGGGYLALKQLGDNLGQYKLDKVLDKAVETQQDMKAEYYGGKSFDIGNFDASVGGVILMAPSAIFAGIFRPAIWDVRNVVMLISSLENTYILLLTLFLLIKLKFFGFFSLINENPLLLFAMLFSLFFAFSVGLTVANFGSLVRLRIPELPFFVSSIFILKHLYETKKKNGLLT